MSQLAVFRTFAVVFWLGIQLLLSGKLGFIDFMVALLSVMFCSFGAGHSGADFSAWKRGFEAAAWLFELADGTVDGDEDPLAEKGDKPEIAGKVAFKNCVFAYPTRPASKIYYKSGDRDGFSLDVDSKTTVAFVGKSGCGKSTALQLLSSVHI